MKPPKFPAKSAKTPAPKGKKGGLGMMPMDLKQDKAMMKKAKGGKGKFC